MALLFLFFDKRLCGPLAPAGFTISRIPTIAPTANSKSSITRLTRASRTSSNYSRPPDVTRSNVEVFLFTIFDLRI